jgi:hypothetical protein
MSGKAKEPIIVLTGSAGAMAQALNESVLKMAGLPLKNLEKFFKTGIWGGKTEHRNKQAQCVKEHHEG